MSRLWELRQAAFVPLLVSASVPKKDIALGKVYLSIMKSWTLARIASCGLIVACLLALATPSRAQRRESPLICPVMQKSIDSVTQTWTHRDVKGARYYLCCQPCEENFDKEPSRYAVAPGNPKEASAIFLFDPITTKRLDITKSVAYSVYGGLLYPFATLKNKAAFDKAPEKYAAQPAKELLYCPVSDEVVKSYDKASDYSDYKGERIYFCCPGCKGKFDRNPKEYEAKMDAFRARKEPVPPATAPIPPGEGKAEP